MNDLAGLSTKAISEAVLAAIIFAVIWAVVGIIGRWVVKRPWAGRFFRVESLVAALGGLLLAYRLLVVGQLSGVAAIATMALSALVFGLAGLTASVLAERSLTRFEAEQLKRHQARESSKLDDERRQRERAAMAAEIPLPQPSRLEVVQDGRFEDYPPLGDVVVETVNDPQKCLGLKITNRGHTQDFSVTAQIRELSGQRVELPGDRPSMEFYWPPPFVRGRLSPEPPCLHPKDWMLVKLFGIGLTNSGPSVIHVKEYLKADGTDRLLAAVWYHWPDSPGRAVIQVTVIADDGDKRRMGRYLVAMESTGYGDPTVRVLEPSTEHDPWISVEPDRPQEDDV